MILVGQTVGGLTVHCVECNLISHIILQFTCNLKTTLDDIGWSDRGRVDRVLCRVLAGIYSLSVIQKPQWMILDG